MATKKKTAAKSASIEEVVNKGYDGINKDLAEIQTGVRVLLTNIGEALSEKLGELDSLRGAVNEEQALLAELHGKERAAQSLAEMKDDLADAQREHRRQLRILETELLDREEDMRRRLEKADLEAQNRRADEERAIKIVWEDKDRVRELAFEKRARDQDDRERQLINMSQDVDSFDERVKDGVEKRVGAIKRDLEYKHAGSVSSLQADKKILEARNEYLENEKEVLLSRLVVLEQSLAAAQGQLSAIATSALDKESGKAALDELRQVAHKQAESKK